MIAASRGVGTQARDSGPPIPEETLRAEILIPSTPLSRRYVLALCSDGLLRQLIPLVGTLGLEILARELAGELETGKGRERRTGQKEHCFYSLRKVGWHSSFGHR